MKKVCILLLLLSIYCIDLFSQEKVGINNNSPQFTLDIRTLSVADSAEFNLGNLDNSHFLRLQSGSSDFPRPSVIWHQDQSLLFGTNLNSFTEIIRIDPNGHLGIRNGNPQYEIDIMGQATNSPAEINVRMIDNSSYLRLNSGRISDPIPKIMWTEDKDLLFATDDATFGYLRKMIITGDGKVGIGMADPAATLDVSGRIKVGEDGSPEVAGQIRWNQSDKAFEGYDGNNWLAMGNHKIKTIGIAEFMESATGDRILRDLNSPSGAYIDDGGVYKANNYIQIPLTFDVGTSIDSIKIILYDNDPDRNLKVTLARVFESSSGTGFGSSITTASESTAHQTVDYSGSVYFNDLMQTFFVASPVSNTGGVSDWGSGNLKIRSVTVYYH